ncbi:EamA family transporter [Natronomonas gomsonensis]|uniref:DMT family transporter n=1 Tax=Natronomonas gomsonensis TaxID=1046043 RepID=UPI0020CA3E3C|nr:EamA family transporter [Natronomonas gomsonensis]MCY4732503.1 EamA family transporter [Natronomonas gomsonensis]
MRYRNLVLFCALAAAWGSAFMAIKAGLGEPGNPAYFFDAPVLFAAVRYDIAGVLMLGYAAWTVDRWRPRGRSEWLLVAVGAVFLIAGYHALLFIGERGTTSAAAAVIVSLSPVLTTAFARALLPQERLTVVGLVGMILGLVGVTILARPDPANLVGSRFEALVFGATLCFALGSVLTRRLDTDLPIETMEAWSMVGGAALMHALSLGLGESVSGFPPLRATVALVYLAVVASAAGFLIYFDLLERLGPIEINLVSYVAPVFAAVAGFLFLQEVIDAPTVLGFLVILVGFLLIKRREIRTELDRHL